jgi:hypothetical protein
MVPRAWEQMGSEGYAQRCAPKRVTAPPASNSARMSSAIADTEDAALSELAALLELAALSELAALVPGVLVGLVGQLEPVVGVLHP